MSRRPAIGGSDVPSVVSWWFFKMDPTQLKAEFQSRFQIFCFFHLGSDAQIHIEETTEGLNLSIEHHRVEPFHFTVSYPELEQLLADKPKLEHFLLSHVTPHRR